MKQLFSGVRNLLRHYSGYRLKKNHLDNCLPHSYNNKNILFALHINTVQTEQAMNLVISQMDDERNSWGWVTEVAADDFEASVGQ